MDTWQLQDAKARLSEVVQRAATQGPQRITVRGRPTAVVISEAEYQRLHGPRPSFVDLMRASPLVGLDLDVPREQTPTRDLDLG